MGDARTSRVRMLAFVLALLLAAGAAAFLAMSLREHDDAQSELSSARVSLRAERAASSTAAVQLAEAHRVVGAAAKALAAVPAAADAVAKLDEQDLGLVKAALQAGLAGDLDSYNQAVDQRDVIDPEHDAAVEKLRQQVNSLITALDQLS